MTEIAAYGTWASPVTSQLLVSDAVSLGDVGADGETLYWVEGRPQEAGRQVLVAYGTDSACRDVLPEGFSVRTLAHEYGGRCYAVRDGVIYFSNFADQRVYRIDPGASPRPITPEPPAERAWRYADFDVTPGGEYLIAVRECHEEGGVTNDLVLLDAEGRSSPRVMATGHDFYMAPTVSADATRLAWIAWDHPRMPWDGTEMHEATLGPDFEVQSTRVVAGGEVESVLQPRYGAAGTLYYVSDRSGWWNLYADTDEGGRALIPRPAEFAQPAWVFGQSTYQPLRDGSLVAVWGEGGRSHLGVVEQDGSLREIACPWDLIGLIRVSQHGFVVTAGSPTTPTVVAEYRGADTAWHTVRESRRLSVDPSYFSVPQAIEFPTEGAMVAHAFYYPPANPDFEAPSGELPPLIVHSHGGPTSQASPVFSMSTQFWTSRGFAVVDVNYGGSTGYGRAYRERLRGQWGVVDLDDCVNAALYLASTGRVDPLRLLIAGGSAGGYTTLCALTFRDVFAAGASHFGVADLTALAADTHKFESRYLDSMVGAWPERRDLYEARSPINHTDRLRTPMILLQGLDDQVVPPSQAQMMIAALAARGVAYAYVPYEGEQHGFRQAQNIINAAESELSFYAQVLGFEPAGDISPVRIENLSAHAPRR